MEHTEDAQSTPRFGCNADNKTSTEFLSKQIRKTSSDYNKKEENKEKYNNSKNEKDKSKNKEEETNNNKEKNKIKENSKNNSFKSKNKIISDVPYLIEHKNENPFDNFLKKKIILRNDFDQNNSEKFLSEKEFAFQQFLMNENADYLEE